MILHPNEQFAPVSVDGFLADADLQQKTQTGWETVGGALPAGGRDLRLDHRTCRAIDGLAAAPCYVGAQARHGTAPVVYGAVRRTKERIDLQYWLWYPFNDFSPTIPAGGIWQVHEGDWEVVSVILDRTGRPLVAGYSQHSAGMRRAWAKVPKQGQRPVVYVALGSHANFFGPGEQPLAPPATEQAAINVMKAYGVAVPADHTGRGRTVRPKLVRVTARAPSWMTFAGSFGETEYLDLPDREPLPAGSGPRGPAFQEHWLRPVADVLSWPRG